ncbi:MAG: hypothetical protein QNK23_12680 [Crocinitomicaceae bacterium]|nr:hypothetical protein [Crocinitomicaceae bacterium]
MSITIKEEHEICLTCGFCCDNTLFDVGRLDDGPISKKFNNPITVVDGQNVFSFPCNCFDKKCTIYNEGIPKVCSKFKCKVLLSAIGGDLSKEASLSMIAEAKTIRDEILRMYLGAFKKTITFRQLVRKVYVKNPAVLEHKVLVIKTQLLDVLIAKHFKTKEQFEDFYELD